MNHLKSLKMEHKLYDVAHQKMCELQQLSMSWIEVRTYMVLDVVCVIVVSAPVDAVSSESSGYPVSMQTDAHVHLRICILPVQE